MFVISSVKFIMSSILHYDPLKDVWLISNPKSSFRLKEDRLQINLCSYYSDGEELILVTYGVIGWDYGVKKRCWKIKGSSGLDLYVQWF